MSRYTLYGVAIDSLKRRKIFLLSALLFMVSLSHLTSSHAAWECALTHLRVATCNWLNQQANFALQPALNLLLLLSAIIIMSSTMHNGNLDYYNLFTRSYTINDYNGPLFLKFIFLFFFSGSMNGTNV